MIFSFSWTRNHCRNISWSQGIGRPKEKKRNRGKVGWYWSQDTNNIDWFLFIHSVMSNSLQPHRLQHARLSWQSLLKLMSFELVMPSFHLVLCYPLLLPSIFPSIRAFCYELALHIRWQKYLELQHQSFQWIFRIGFLEDWLIWSPFSPREFQEFFSNITVQKHHFFRAQPSL